MHAAGLLPADRADRHRRDRDGMTVIGTGRNGIAPRNRCKHEDEHEDRQEHRRYITKHAGTVEIIIRIALTSLQIAEYSDFPCISALTQ